MSPHVNFIDKPWDENAHLWGFKGSGWYFWDETGASCYGPYVSEIIAVKALDKYAEWLTSEQVTIVAPVDRAHAHYDRSKV